MKNKVVRGFLRTLATGLAAGSMLAACGGGDTQGANTSASKLLANGEACNAAWVSTSIYVGGAKVSYNGVNYTAAYWTQGNNPSTSSGATGSGQPWLTGFTCGGVTTSTTTTKASTTTTGASTTTTSKASTTTTSAGSTTTTKATTTTTVVSSCPVYVAGAAYSIGQTVSNAGAYYTCDVAGWCSSGASAYAPGVGWAWTSAWHAASVSACPGGTTTTQATTSTTAATTSTTKATTSTTGSGSTTTTASTSTTTVTSGGREVGGYFAQWGVYGRAYEVADVHTSGAAGKMTFLNYAFGNVYAKNGGYECDMVTHAEVGNTTPTSPDAGNGGDAEADYIRTPARTVDGQAIAWDAPLSGNFFQLKKLKAAHPNLKVLISLGGWSWSKNFSKASATDALRKQMVSSCLKQFIKGDLPVQEGRGGAGVAKGVFDGIDVDYEYPGGGGQPYNSFDPVNDKHNYTLLMAEFRAQLDALGATDGKHYLLTAAIGAGTDKIDQTEPALYGQYMDWVNAMTYDFHGGWEATTNFHSPLFHDAADPSIGSVAKYNTNDGIQYLITKGMPKNKINLGIPFYGRGWTGVPAGPAGNGLYQTATGMAPGTYEAGIDDYKVLKAKAGTRFYHPVTKELYLYTGAGGQWWSYDDVTVIASKVQYIKDQGLKGAFTWELDGDANGELSAAVWLVH